MVEEVKKKFVGEWEHLENDQLQPFFEAVGATDAEKTFMLGSTPRLLFEVDDDDNIRLCDIPYPETRPEDNADVKFKLDQDFSFEPRGHTFQVTVTMTDGIMLQTINPVQSHTAAHTIELSVTGENELVQKYKTTDSTGKEVIGTRRYKKKTAST